MHILKDPISAGRFHKIIFVTFCGAEIVGAEKRYIILFKTATMSHAAMPEPERRIRGITDGLVRLSVGLEDTKDICDDLKQAIQSGKQ